jgi:hypothetical protein
MLGRAVDQNALPKPPANAARSSNSLTTSIGCAVAPPAQQRRDGLAFAGKPVSAVLNCQFQNQPLNVFSSSAILSATGSAEKR